MLESINLMKYTVIGFAIKYLSRSRLAYESVESHERDRAMSLEGGMTRSIGQSTIL